MVTKMEIFKLKVLIPTYVSQYKMESTITVTRDSLRALKAAFEEEKKRKEEEFRRAAIEEMNRVIRPEIDKIKETLVKLATEGRDQAVIQMEKVPYNTAVIAALREELEGVTIKVREEWRDCGNTTWSVVTSITLSWA